MANDDMKADEMADEAKEQVWEMMKDFLAGFEISRGVRMPGPVTSVEEFSSKEGRSAANKVTGESLKGFEDVAKMSKAAWPKIKEELKAEAEKKKSAEDK